MDWDEAAQRAAAARDEMQKLAQTNEASTLQALQSYLRSREATYEAFKRLDPHSQHTQDALALLEKARSDLATFKKRFGSSPDDDSSGNEVPVDD